MSDAPIRLLFCSASFLPIVGGLEVLAGELLPELRDRGFEILVVTTRMADEAADDDLDGIPIRRLEMRGTRNIFDVARIAPAFVRTVRDFRPDVVHSHDSGPFPLVHIRTPAPRAPLVVTLHTVLSNRLTDDQARVTRRMLQATAWVTGVSHAVLDDARRLEPDIGPRSSVVHNGVRWPAAGAFPEEPTVLCVGRLSPEKGFDLVLQAMRHLVDAGSPARLAIAGEGAERPALDAFARELGIDDRVQLLGSVDRSELPTLMERATVIAMPSRIEGLPLVAVEAAMSGRPIVATKVGGLPEVVHDGRTGVLVPPEDPEALARALGTLLADRDRCAALGAAGRAMALQAFSFGACVDGYEALLRRVAERAALLP